MGKYITIVIIWTGDDQMDTKKVRAAVSEARRFIERAEAVENTEYRRRDISPTDSGCRFPIGERDGTRLFLWCNAPQWHGGPYCAHHHTRAYRPRMK